MLHVKIVDLHHLNFQLHLLENLHPYHPEQVKWAFHKHLLWTEYTKCLNITTLTRTYLSLKNKSYNNKTKFVHISFKVKQAGVEIGLWLRQLAWS